MINSLHPEFKRFHIAHVADAEYGDVHAPRFRRDLAALERFLKPRSRVLEIAPYIGWLSIALAKSYHRVSTFQPAHHQAQFQERFDIYGIDARSGEFPVDRLPFEPESFDAIIFCEALEHFAFNPLPIVEQMYAALAPGGRLYVTTPNQATLKNAIRLLAGHSINDSVSNFVYDKACYDPRGHLDYGLHWREYAMGDLTQLLELAGFQVEKRRYRQYESAPRGRQSLFKRITRGAYRALSLVRPALFSGMLEVVARKPDVPEDESVRQEVTSRFATANLCCGE